MVTERGYSISAAFRICRPVQPVQGSEQRYMQECLVLSSVDLANAQHIELQKGEDRSVNTVMYLRRGLQLQGNNDSSYKSWYIGPAHMQFEELEE
ncbi:hypothetical protein T310_7067 [Rasamsonia emersonii CBS 393.64]|uniref:Uncharacterized protein n=1 Tax=Rasamsonia emersonii (strain ATCC 16479 / CBS 393.64 / IMI 116815) TaxID=1408163 RepID=A0A0F4YM96_RASE3|nr:hypothetical protein T310_7067 [Rasamsonia emersonii CBS 393.64]KKA18981.1 hypothetical protein T310_7067 [Rasamsonia emersonii CBS 393.64]